MKAIKSFVKRLLQKLLGKFYMPLLLFKKKYFPNKGDKQEAAALLKRAAFYQTYIQPGDLVFDVGANMGNRIVPLLAAGARVVAVEPQERCCRYLQKKFGNNIILLKKGLSNKEEILDLHLSADTVFSSFSTQWIDSVKKRRLRNVRWNKTESVQMTTLDQLIARYGTPVFIKIDVEGFELQVLQGLTKRFQLICYEYTTPEQTAAAQQCLLYLQSINPHIQCNYAIGESMQLEFESWKSAADMLEFITTPAFIDTRFGDIYVRSTQQPSH